jgi:hypothetical protein
MSKHNAGNPGFFQGSPSLRKGLLNCRLEKGWVFRLAVGIVRAVPDTFFRLGR